MNSSKMVYSQILMPGPQTPTLQRIKRLQEETSKLPQIELETKHYFADGMYCRELTQPAGSLVVGKVHLREHFFILTSGSLRVVNENGIRDLEAPCVMVSNPGTKRVILAVTHAVYVNVHRTSETDIDKIEEELIEPDVSAMFDARNMVKKPALEGVACEVTALSQKEED